MWLARLSGVLTLLTPALLGQVAEAARDGVYDDVKLTRLAFGSCNKQYKNQTLWPHIVGFKPQVYLWTGDTIYVKDGTVPNLRKQFEKQLQNPGYRKLVESGAIIEGVYDDHDYGENDAGATAYLQGRQDAYLDFLGHVASDSPRRSRHGLYSSHTFGKPPHQVSVIFLDTRSNRAPPALNIPVPEWVPLKPFVLAALRWLSISFGITQDYAGDMLGEEQWVWLENELKESQASVHIIVSTVQVLSTNPIVEGWGHFPVSQRRLVALLNKYSPKGLLLLSGDVHFAEILSTEPQEAEGPKTPLEITSSGMTHTCVQTALGACKVALLLYNRHRLTPESVYAGLNYGTIEVDWDVDAETLAMVTARVRNSRGKGVLEVMKNVPLAAGEPVDLGQPCDIMMNHDRWAAFAALALLFWSTLAWLAWAEASEKNRVSKAAAAAEAEAHRKKGEKKESKKTK